MTLGNWLFSPELPEQTIHAFLFRINDEGLYNGIAGALKRNAMIVLSFAWLSSIHSLHDVYKALDYKKAPRKFLMVFLKWIQNLSKDFKLLYYSMQLRGFDLKTINLKKKVRQLQIILVAILNRFFTDIGKMTFNGESHFNYGLSTKGIDKEIIKLRNLSVSYSSSLLPALSNITLSITPGEFVLISGANGYGKSTLLKTICGYIPKLEGEILEGIIQINGIDTNSNATLEEISQVVRLLVENPTENILGLTVEQELSSQSKDKERIEKYAELFSIANLMERDTDTLSGGETTRLVLASLMCSNANVIVLESPLGQLDIQGRSAFVEAMKEVKSLGKTVILSETEIETFRDLIDRTIILSEGKVVEDYETSSISVDDLLAKHGLTYPQMHKAPTQEQLNELSSFKNVSLMIDGHTIVNNLELTIYQRDCIAIMGENGSGKTTAMLLLSKALSSTTGEISNSDLKVGMVFQDCTKQVLYSTVGGELPLLAQNSNNLSEIEIADFVDYYTDWLDLNKDKETLDLSASQIRLLEVTSNIFNRDIVIMDEPSNYLSGESLKKLNSLIIDLLNSGTTVIIVTHDYKLAEMCNRYVLMDNSRIVLDTRNMDELISTQKRLHSA